MQKKGGRSRQRFCPSLPAREATFQYHGIPGDRSISIHASREGSDNISGGVLGYGSVFQSTLPAGEATALQEELKKLDAISIHASREGSDAIRKKHTLTHTNFNPRLPRGKRPVRTGTGRHCLEISIHASRGGSDPCPVWHSGPGRYFNPRFPRGKRRICRRKSQCLCKFQSTLPAGEATAGLIICFRVSVISIHASRGGSDLWLYSLTPLKHGFQSTLPAGEATAKSSTAWFMASYFNPRFPRGKRPCKGQNATICFKISIHASRGGSDTIER